MKKIKLLPSIIMLALCLAVLGIGVYSATTGSNTITGTLTVNSAGHEVEIAVYKGCESTSGSRIGTTAMYGTQIGATTTSRAGRSISLSDIRFNSDEANTVYDVDVIDLIISITNKSADDVGVYFWNGVGEVPAQITSSDITAGKVLYGHQSLNGVDSATELVAHNDIVDAEYAFYHHIPGYYTLGSGTDSNFAYGVYTDNGGKRYYTEYMHVYLRLKDAGFATEDLKINLNMNLNVEDYVSTPNLSSAGGFVKGATASDSYGSGATHIVLPYVKTELGVSEFETRPSLVSITIPSSVTTMNPVVFMECTGLTSIMLPSSLTTLGDTAFTGCTSLTSVYIPYGVTTVDTDSFALCPGIRYLTVSGTVTSFVAGICSGSNLLSVKVASDNSNYDSRNNCQALVEKATNTLIRGSSNTIIPSTVTILEDGAFSGITGFSNISIPDSITTIRAGAFENCSGLSSVIIPNSVTTLGASIFEGCTGLTNVIVKSSLISNRMFCDCSGITSLVISSDVNQINAQAFYGCSSLSTIFIPSSVTTISGSSAGFSLPFWNCSSSLVINCEAASKPAGWGTYWNYYDSTHSLTTNWSQTR